VKKAKHFRYAHRILEYGGKILKKRLKIFAECADEGMRDINLGEIP
jgi:hypothetical protein